MTVHHMVFKNPAVKKKCICIIPVLRHYAYKIKKKRQIWNHITHEIIE